MWPTARFAERRSRRRFNPAASNRCRSCREIAATLRQMDCAVGAVGNGGAKAANGSCAALATEPAADGELASGSDWNIADPSGVGARPGRPGYLQRRDGNFGAFAATRLDRRRRGDAHGEARAGGARRRQRAPASGGRDSAAGHVDRRRLAGAGSADHVAPGNSRGARVRRIRGAKRDLRAADERVPVAKPQRAAGQRPGAADDHRRRAGRGLGRAPQPDGI